MEPQRRVARNAEASLGMSQKTFALIAERRRQETDICHLFDLFFEGRAPPFRNVREAGMGLALSGAAKKLNGTMEGMVMHISESADVDLWLTVKILSGLFRVDELGTREISRLASAVNLTLDNLLNMTHIEIVTGKSWIRYDFPKGILIKLLRNDREGNPDRYEECVNAGAEVRMQRTPQGITRPHLSMLTGVDVNWIDLLEHGNIPTERLYPNIDHIAEKLETSTQRLLDEGYGLLSRLAPGESFDMKIARLKAHIDEVYFFKTATDALP